MNLKFGSMIISTVALYTCTDNKQRSSLAEFSVTVCYIEIQVFSIMILNNTTDCRADEFTLCEIYLSIFCLRKGTVSILQSVTSDSSDDPVAEEA